MNIEEEKDVISYLESMSSIDKFYLHRFLDTGRALIHYFDEDGESWAVMEDDDSFLSRCLEYLCKNEVREFSDIEELKKYETEMSLKQRA